MKVEEDDVLNGLSFHVPLNVEGSLPCRFEARHEVREGKLFLIRCVSLTVSLHLIVSLPFNCYASDILTLEDLIIYKILSATITPQEY